MHIADPVATAAASRGDAPFAILPNRTVSYAQLDRMVSTEARRLKLLGVEPGQHVAIHLPGSEHDPDLVLANLVLLMSILRHGATAVPLDSRFPPPYAEEMADRLQVATTIGASELSPGAISDTDSPVAGSPRWRMAAPAAIVLTSGSEGRPKGALLTVSNLVSSARSWDARLPHGPGEAWLLTLPMHHVAGLGVLFRVLLGGLALGLPARGESLHDSCFRSRATRVSLVSTQLRRALADNVAPPVDRLVLVGGSAIPQDLVASAREHGWPVASSYGLTEMTSTVTATEPADSPDALGTTGTVLPEHRVRLASSGEIHVAGPSRFAGYVEGAVISRPFDSDGWFASGDLGRWEVIAGRRMLRVVGRIGSRFVSGGENIQPEIVEAELGRLPGVARAMVVPVDDPDFGLRPVAFADADPWDPVRWETALRERLPGFMVPDRYLRWPTERGSGIKASRSEFAQLAAKLR